MGASSTIEAIALETPMLLIPQANDEPLNAKIIEEFGAGVLVDQTKKGKELEKEVKGKLEK